MVNLDVIRSRVSKLYITRKASDATVLYCSVVLFIMVLLVVYPLINIILYSFQVSEPGGPISYGFGAWNEAFQSPAIRHSIKNTFHLTFWRQVIAFPLALTFVWLIARTDLPFRNGFEFLFWIAFFLPGLTIVQGYIMLFDPQYGIVNRALASLPVFDRSTFDIFSFWGIVFAHLATNTVAINVMLLTPAFRNMDGSFEEAAEVAGSSKIGTLTRITVPIMAPTVLAVFLMSTIRALETFEIEMVLGAPKNISVYSMEIYYFIQSEPPEFGPATALSVMVLLLMVPLVICQQLATRKSYTTIGGQYKPKIIPLGRWRWYAFALIAGIVVFTTLLPITMLIMGTFMKLWGFFNLPDPWTLQHWRTVLSDPLFMRSVINTLIIALGSALGGASWCLVVAYIVVKTRFWGRGLLDFISWLPLALPGMILGLGYLWLLLGVPILSSLYGTTVVLIIVLVISAMTSKIQILRGNLMQVGQELEDASRVCGSGWLYCFRTVVLPLVGKAALVAALLGFVSAARNVSHVALLTSSANRPLSMLQLDYLIEGRNEPAAILGVLLVALSVGAGVAVRFIGFRAGT